MLTVPSRAHQPREPLRVAVVTSRRAPGLSHVLEQDPERGRLYEIVTGLASDPGSAAMPQLTRAGIPTQCHDLGAFCAERGGRRGDLVLRAEYDRRTAELLEPYRPQLIVLCGYLHIVTAPLLIAYPTAIVNIHDADLLVLDESGRPRFRGLHSTYDALAAGRLETRSTAHLVTAEVDHGPPLVRSRGFPAHPMVADAIHWSAEEILKAYAFAQREWMMRSAWGPLLVRVIHRFALGQVRWLDGRAVIGGRIGPDELRPDAGVIRRAAES